MPDAKEIQNFLDKERYAPGVLSSNCILECALRNGKLSKGGTTDRLIGETFFRHWLFKGQLPDPLKELFEHEELAEERTLFLAQKWEEQNELSPSFSYLKDRIDTFEKAEGIIALVNTEDKEALPIPFTFGSSLSKPGVWDDSSQNPQEIFEWTEYLEEILSLLDSGLSSVKINVPLGPFAQMVEGRSLMLALALAIARREDPTLPPPLEVLATGSIINGKIGPVEHMNEKMTLAKRMQARIVAVLEKPPTHSFASSENENLTDFLGRWQARFGKVLPPMLKSHFESWRTHINNFKGRDKLVNQILDRLKDKEKGGHVALIMPEGMGKSALLTLVSNVLSKEARKSGKYQGSREICPWLPGCLLHMGKFGSNPHRVVESLLTQANSMLTNPVSIPEEPVRKAPKRLDRTEEGSKPEPPDYREIYRTQREALSHALGKLVEEKKEIFLLIDALDEINVDKGFLCIFPDPFPVGVRVMITGRNCQQVDSFMDRRSGFERIEPQKLEREEIPAITGVPEDSEDAKQFNDKVHQKTGGWTYAVKETEKRIKQNNGVFSDNLICNREETLNRMAEAWKGELLEDALAFLLWEELFHSIDNSIKEEPGSYIAPGRPLPKINLSSGSYENFAFKYLSPGPNFANLCAFLKFRGHDISLKLLRKKLDAVRDQLIFFTGSSYLECDWSSGFGSRHKSNTTPPKNEPCLSFALRIVPEHCILNYLASDFDQYLENICKWMVHEEKIHLLWRLGLIISPNLKHNEEHFTDLIEIKSTNGIGFTKDHKKIGDRCWAQISKRWPPSSMVNLPTHFYESAMYELVILTAVELGDKTHQMVLADFHLGCYGSLTLNSDIEADKNEGIRLLEDLIENDEAQAGEAAFNLGCDYLGFDPTYYIFDFYLTGSIDHYQNETKGLEWLEYSFERGHAYARLLLGAILIDERFSMQDIPRGILILEEFVADTTLHKESKWLAEKAAELLARSFWEVNHDKKIEYTKKSIELGNNFFGQEVISNYWKESLKSNNQEEKKLALELIKCALESELYSFEIRDLFDKSVLQETYIEEDLITPPFDDFFEPYPPIGSSGISLRLENTDDDFPSFGYYTSFGVPQWGYSPDYNIRKYLDKVDDLPVGLQEQKDLIQIIWDNYSEKKLAPTQKNFGILYLLNVSATIKSRDFGRKCREEFPQLDSDLISLLKGWYECTRGEDCSKVFWVRNLLNLHSGKLPVPSPELVEEIKDFLDKVEYSPKDPSKQLNLWFCINGPVAVLPVINWLDWEENPQDSDWKEADEKIRELAESGFRFNEEKDLIPRHNPSSFFSEGDAFSGYSPDYNWLAREGHPLYDMSVGMLVRHNIYEDPDGLNQRQRFDMARKGGVQVPEWMDKPLSQKK